MDIVVQDRPDESRYAITVDGVFAGRAEYRDIGDERVFFHTRVEDEFGGRGLASRLAHDALGDAKESGRRIVPVCPFIVHYLESHHEVDDVLAKPTPAILEALERG